MDRTHVNIEIARAILGESFERPSSFPESVQKKVTKNRSLGSVVRRSTTDFLYQSLRWRRRLWGDIQPASLEEAKIATFLEDARKLKDNPPLSKWATLSMDQLGRELSYPTFLVDRFAKQYGFQSAVSLLLALNEPAPVTIRANTLKISPADLLAKLKGEKISARIGTQSPWALHLNERKNLRGFTSFKNGLFEIQDEGSQIAVMMAEAKPGEKVIDACAGAGGKSLALAAAMENQGEILALDSDTRKFAELKKRAKRSGVSILRHDWIASDDPVAFSEWEEKADLVFVDAPCSGLGTLRRSPWLKWRLSQIELGSFPRKQSFLLSRAARWVKPHGRLVYVTCSLDKSENELVIEKFMKANVQFAVKETRQLRPDTDGTDGFFISVLKRCP